MISAPISSAYPWLSINWQRFTDQVRQGSLSHAQLICSSKGIGAIELANSKAKYLLCLSRAKSEACGVCKSCRLFDSEGHPDFKSVLKEDNSAEIKVDQIRRLVAPINQTSLLGGAKVILLFPADAMNINAANALLKNLEEPPQNTYFLLITYSVASVLATVRSRCVLDMLPTPSKDQAKAWLFEQGIEDYSLLAEAGGAPLIVKEWLAGGLLEERQALNNILRSFMFDDSDLINSSKQLIKLDYSYVLSQFLLWLQNAIKVQHGNGFYNDIDERLSHCSAVSLFSLLDKVLHQKAAFDKGAHLNAQLAVEELLMNINVSLSSARKVV